MQLPKTVFFLFLFHTCSAKDTLPVFMVDAERTMAHLIIEPNPFVKISSTHFFDILHDVLKRSDCIIIFVEDKLCSEDISLKDKLGTPYSRLRGGILDHKVKYLPAVVNPYKMLTQVFRPQQSNVFYLSSGTKLHLPEGSKYLYVYFQDGANDTRSQSLRRHDLIMQEVYFAVRQVKTGPVVAFYTGKINPVAVEKLNFVPIKPKDVPKDMGIMVITKGALFRFSGVFTVSAQRRGFYNQMPLIAEETWTRRRLATIMAYTDFELQFNFSFGDEQWLLDNVALLEDGEEVGRTDMRVGAPWNWSYVCGEPLTVVNTRDGSAITISRYQVQPIHPKIARGGDDDDTAGGGDSSAGGEDDSTKCFGKSVNCGPYFNTHIISGLFVTLICTGVLTYGLLMLYNCGTNNKFDDPHGKEIVISTMEHH